MADRLRGAVSGAAGAAAGTAGGGVGPGSWVVSTAVLVALFTTLFAALVAGCAPEPSGPAFAARDSAGIHIVESERPSLPPGSGWEVGPEAVLMIGEREGAVPYEFSDVTGATRFSDSSVAVADFLSQEVRFFGPEGTFRTAIGGRGGGPGEFQGLCGLGPAPADRAWAYDCMTRRLVWLDASGKIVHEATLEPEPPILAPVGALSDGTFVLKQMWGVRAVAGAERTGMRRDPVAWVRFDSTGALVDTIGTFPGREVLLTEEGGRGVMNTPVVGRTSVGTVVNGTVIVGSQDAFELRKLSPDGRTLAIYRVTGHDYAFRPGEIEAYIDSLVQNAPPDRRARERERYASMPVPQRRPAYGAVRSDAAGNLWIAEWTRAPVLPRLWTVLDTAGVWTGDVELPGDFVPMEIGSDWILGTELDAMDVERVVLYPVVKPGR